MRGLLLDQREGTMTLKTKPFDTAEYLDDDTSQAELLSEALHTGDINVITAALGLVARARGMSQLAQETGITRSALYSALKEGGNPTLDTVLKVLRALGVSLEAKPARELESV
jgi:probable addiction module antidote protein